MQSGSADSLLTELHLSKPDSNRVKVLLEIGQSYIFKPGQLESDLDTALLMSRQAYGLSRSIHYFRGQGLSELTSAQAYREKGNKALGRQSVQRAIDLLTKHGTKEDLADAYMELANFYTVAKADIQEKIRIYDHIILVLQNSNDKLKLAEAFKYRGDLYQLHSNNIQAMTDLKQALALFESIGHRQMQEVYDLLGFVSSKMGDYEAGIKYGLLAMQKAESFKDSVKLVKLYSRLGITYKELDQPEKALFYFNKSLSIAQTQHRKTTIIHLATTINAIIEAFVTVDESLRIEEALAHLQNVVKELPPGNDDLDSRMAVATCFVNYYGRLLHQYAKAQPFCDQLEQMLGANLGEDYLLYIHGVLIPFYIQSKQYEKAQRLLAKNEIICYKTLYMKELSLNHLWWFKLDSARADYPSAIRHYQRYNTLTDSLLTEVKNQKIAQLEVEYQTREKEHSIRQLTTQSRLQEVKLKEAQTTRNFIISGVIMLLLLLGVIYNRYRLKQRSSNLMEAKQIEINHKNQSLEQMLNEKNLLLTEKEWMLKEIHHRVKNNLQVVMSLLNSQAHYLSDDTAISAIQESQHRVQAMALIHQKLYQSERVSRIDMASYIQDVVVYLQDSYRHTQPLNLRLNVEPIEMDVTVAVPLGLIINEAITNAFKYAFPYGQPGTIILELHRLSATTYELAITDNGVGLPAGYNPISSRSLGMTLIHGFSAQLGGELLISSPPGLKISLVFAEAQLSQVYSRTEYA